MLAGLVLLETLSLVLFAVLLIRQETHQVYQRTQQRLAHQATSMALQAEQALSQDRPGWVGLSVKMMGDGPSVAFAKITDPAGNLLYVSEGEPEQIKLNAAERAQIPLLVRGEPRVFNLGKDRWESVRPIYSGRELRGYAWVETDRAWDREELNTFLRGTVLFGAVWIVASGLLVLLMAARHACPDGLAGKRRQFSFARGRAQRDWRPDRGFQPHGRFHRGATLGAQRYAVAAGLDAGQRAHRPGLF
jgi:hypothetical protein